MNQKDRLIGRFLPSRVYARWVWPVRCALFVLPSILFLAGALVLFLAPSEFQSKTVFKYLGERSSDEVVSLLKSSRILDNVVDSLELSRRYNVDTDAAVAIIASASRIQFDPVSRLIEIKVTHTDKEDARNIASETVSALRSYEKQGMTTSLSSQIEDSERSATQSRDEAEIKKETLAKLIKVRADVLSDPVAQLDIDAARSDWESSLARTFELQNQINRLNQELASPRDWIEVHSEAEIPSSPIGKKADESLGTLIVRSLLIGLGCALTLPYLLELCIPRRPFMKDKSTDVAFENPVLPDPAVNG